MKDSAEDLSVRARRGELTEAEERRLRVLLDASVEVKLLHWAGTAFDAENSMLAGDEARAERVGERVLAKRRELRSRREARAGFRHARFSWVAAVACLSAVVTAGTLLAAQRFGGESLRALFTFERSAPPPAPKVTRSVPVSPPEPAKSAASHEVPPLAVPAASTGAAPAARAAARSSGPSEGASALFASASLARREGSPAAAIELYTALQRRYPNSVEAHAADQSLGMLYLQRGQPARALGHFEDILRRSPRGEFASEALWGKASALSSLGRGEQAQQEFSRLIERYPSSPYASAARAKLNAARPKP